MTPQEALKIRNNPTFDDADNVELSKCIDEALEKQIPKKPTDIFTPVVTWGICPVCKGELSKFKNRPNRVLISNSYCPDCGQALDWSKN